MAAITSSVKCELCGKKFARVLSTVLSAALGKQKEAKTTPDGREQLKHIALIVVWSIIEQKKKSRKEEVNNAIRNAI